MWRPNGRHGRLFFGLWLFIILVSAIDGYLVLRHRHLMLAVERNPIGRLLIAWDGGRVRYLLAAKFLGTVVVCAVLQLIHRYQPLLGLLITAVLACMQLCLLLYLLLT
jgi:hypothetical protein